MSAAPVTENAARRRIGDILLEHGFASEAELAEAVADQERSGQPLGQILVQQGVITRLELASALAEQWSDQSVGLSFLPVPKPAPRPAPQHGDDDQYAARLQDAVADLARRVQATEPSEADDDRITDLAQRVEATVARSQRIEATLATLAESLEGVTGGVEEAFTSLQGGMAGLALELARIDTTVAELLARPVEVAASDPVLVARLEELATSVQDLAERPVGDDALRGHVDELAAHVENLVDAPALTDLRVALGDVQGRVDALAAGAPAFAELERQTDFLNDLRATVVDLEARPVGSPEIDERLERIESRLAERLAAVPDAAAVEALAARVETAFERQEGANASVVALTTRLDEIAALTGRDDGTRARVDDLEGRLAAGTATLVELRRELSGRPEPPSARKLEKIEGALDALRRDVSSLAGVKPDDRIEHLVRRTEELAADRDAHRLLGGRLEALETRVPPDLVTGADLTRALDGIRDELLRLEPRQDGRVDELVCDLEAVRAELARTREDVTTRASEPDERIEQLTSELTELRADLARARYEVSQTAPEPDGRVDQLAHDLDAVRAQLMSATPEPDPRIDQLTADLTSIRADLARVGAASTPDPELANRIEQLAGRVEELAAAPGPHAALEAELRQVEQRLEDLSRTLEERLATAGSAPSATSSRPDGLEDELERTRMAIERVGLHLGEHDRALAEMRGSRTVTLRLDELAARIDDLAAGGPPPSEQSGAGERSSVRRSIEPDLELRSLVRRLEDVEEAASAGREKLMTRLERMASSIDWRLQRLEAGDPE